MSDARRPLRSGRPSSSRAGLDAARAATVTLVTTLTRADGRPVAEWRSERPLATGANQVDWHVSVDRPELWWPAALGDQPLYDLAVSVEIDGEQSDRRQVRTGLRQIRMRNFVASVNGERLFLKGANQGPTRQALAEACAGDFEADVILARRAGLDLLRIHGHISRPELYEAADRHGLLLWQDLPLHRGYARVRRQAMRQAAEAVDLLGHHPSIAVWCAHNEPVATSGPGDDETASSAHSSWVGFAAGQTLPTINKTRLDRSVRRTLEKADASRPVDRPFGRVPPPGLGNRHPPLPRLAVRQRARVAGPAGSAYPCSGGSSPSSAPRPSPTPPTSASRSGGPTSTGRTWPAPTPCKRARSTSTSRPPPTPASRRGGQASQRYQAQLVRFHIETLRRLKYRPAGGFCLFLFADSEPAVSCAVLDDQRQPKAAFEALAAACAPVIVVADRLAPSYAPGQSLDINVHVVSDLRAPLEGNRVQARLSWPGGARQWTFGGDVGADSCIRVGGLRHVLPADTGNGPVRLDLDLEWLGGQTHSTYESHVSSVTTP